MQTNQQTVGWFKPERFYPQLELVSVEMELSREQFRIEKLLEYCLNFYSLEDPSIKGIHNYLNRILYTKQEITRQYYS